MLFNFFKKTHNNKNNDRIAIFISIPKNASHSVRNILKLGKNRDKENTSSLIIYENHQRASKLSKKYDLNNLFVFCFSRNPYDRCISWYEYFKNIEPYNSFTFESWVNNGMPHHFKIQNETDYVTEGISPLLQYNYVEQYKIDYVGRIENFNADLKIIIEKLNTYCNEKNIKHKFVFKNEKLNTSKRNQNMEHYFDTKTKETVYTLLKKDFEHFGYKK